MTLTYSPDIDAKIVRVRTGSERIWSAYNSALAINLDTDAGKWHQEQDRIARAVEKLQWLRLELEALGYDKCIYPEPKCSVEQNTFCWACPSKTEHWLCKKQEG